MIWWQCQITTNWLLAEVLLHSLTQRTRIALPPPKKQNAGHRFSTAKCDAQVVTSRKHFFIVNCWAGLDWTAAPHIHQSFHGFPSANDCATHHNQTMKNKQWKTICIKPKLDLMPLQDQWKSWWKQPNLRSVQFACSTISLTLGGFQNWVANLRNNPSCCTHKKSEKKTGI